MAAQKPDHEGFIAELLNRILTDNHVKAFVEKASSDPNQLVQDMRATVFTGQGEEYTSANEFKQVTEDEFANRVFNEMADVASLVVCMFSQRQVPLEIAGSIVNFDGTSRIKNIEDIDLIALLKIIVNELEKCGLRNAAQSVDHNGFKEEPDYLTLVFVEIVLALRHSRGCECGCKQGFILRRCGGMGG